MSPGSVRSPSDVYTASQLIVLETVDSQVSSSRLWTKNGPENYGREVDCLPTLLLNNILYVRTFLDHEVFTLKGKRFTPIAMGEVLRRSPGLSRDTYFHKKFTVPMSFTSVVVLWKKKKKWSFFILVTGSPQMLDCNSHYDDHEDAP